MISFISGWCAFSYVDEKSDCWWCAIAWGLVVWSVVGSIMK
jgi:hypothetical protein